MELLSFLILWVYLLISVGFTQQYARKEFYPFMMTFLFWPVMVGALIGYLVLKGAKQDEL